VTISLQYDDSVTDTSDLHIYHYTGGEWVVEDTNRTIDTVNKTISADVTSLSPFQVAEGSSSESSGGSSSGSTASSGGGSGGCRLAAGPVPPGSALSETVLLFLPLAVLLTLRLRKETER